MKVEERLIVSRDELAKLLLDTAKGILENGRIGVGKFAAQLPDTFELELELKEKNGRTKFEIEIAWQPEMTATALDPAAHALAPMPTALPPSFKGVKKEMESRLLAMAEAVRSSRLPSIDEVERLGVLAADFSRRAKPEWDAGAAAVIRAVERLRQAVAAGNRADAHTALDRLVKVRDDYHRQFK